MNLIERLRAGAGKAMLERISRARDGLDTEFATMAEYRLSEAADALSLIEAERDKLREALEPFAALLDPIPTKADHIEIAALSGDAWDQYVDDALSLTIADFRRARAALHPTDNDHGDGR